MRRYLTRLITAAPIHRCWAETARFFQVCHHVMLIGKILTINLGPNVNSIDYEVPDGCFVDTAAFVSRHGSRYPDASAYYQWTNLSAKVYTTPQPCAAPSTCNLLLTSVQIHSASFTATGVLSFLTTWEPVLQNPAQEISAVSLGGYRELSNMGIDYRLRYPNLYSQNTPFTVWANQYPAAPRVIDSAILFARGFMGPNSTLGEVIVLPSTSSQGVGNSLAPSDSCPKYLDDSGGVRISSIYHCFTNANPFSRSTLQPGTTSTWLT